MLLKKISKFFLQGESAFIMSVAGIIYFSGWAFYVLCGLLYLNSKNNSTGEFIPMWKHLNNHPVIVIIGIICFIVLCINYHRLEKEGKI